MRALRGRNGRYELSAEPEEITVADVLHAGGEIVRLQMAVDPIDVEGTHRDVVLQPSTHRAILDVLSGAIGSDDE